LIAMLVERIEQLAGQHGTVGVGLPGSLDPRTGMAKGASSTWLNGRPVEDDLRRVLERPVRTAKDADCFVASEATDGAGRGHRLVFGVILGSGAGAGIQRARERGPGIVDQPVQRTRRGDTDQRSHRRSADPGGSPGHDDQLTHRHAHLPDLLTIRLRRGNPELHIHSGGEDAWCAT
jgi:ROK family protein